MLASILSIEQHLELLPYLNSVPEHFESHNVQLADAAGSAASHYFRWPMHF